MPVGFAATTYTCETCFREQVVIETTFLVCQKCQAIQHKELKKAIAHFLQQIQTPLQPNVNLFHMWEGVCNPLSLLVHHIRIKGSHHRFYTNDIAQKHMSDLHPSYLRWTKP